MTVGLGYELKKYNVDVQAFRPAGVVTGMMSGPKAPPMTISAEECTDYALSKMTAGVHFGHWKHGLIGNAILTGTDLVDWFGEWAMTKVSLYFLQHQA